MSGLNIFMAQPEALGLEAVSAWSIQHLKTPIQRRDVETIGGHPDFSLQYVVTYIVLT